MVECPIKKNHIQNLMKKLSMISFSNGDEDYFSFTFQRTLVNYVEGKVLTLSTGEYDFI